MTHVAWTCEVIVITLVDSSLDVESATGVVTPVLVACVPVVRLACDSVAVAETVTVAVSLGLGLPEAVTVTVPDAVRVTVAVGVSEVTAD